MRGLRLEMVEPMSRSVYLIEGQQFRSDCAHFKDAIASAHAVRHRPRCLCTAKGVEMYVARLGEGFLVKRMPGTGAQHASHCPAYEPPAELTGLDELMGSAITENTETGQVTLKLGFATSRRGGGSTVPVAVTPSDRVRRGGTLSLRNLLNYLWEQAELNRWHPGFAGKRSWAVVRRHLLQAAENKVARGAALSAKLYVPETFSVEQRHAINARRAPRWALTRGARGGVQNLGLLIGEVKEMVPARLGHKLVIKHVPDHAFLIDEQAYRRIERRFEQELAVWTATDRVHLLTIATFYVDRHGFPRIAELSLMPTTDEWIPIEDSFDRVLIKALVDAGRAFIKVQRSNSPPRQIVPSAILIDVGNRPVNLYVSQAGAEPRPERSALSQVEASDGWPSWKWDAGKVRLPPIPRPCTATRMPLRSLA
jgi:hypothetical protein